MRKFIKKLREKGAKFYHFITMAIGLYAIWYWAFYLEGEKLSTCVILSCLVVFGQLTSLAQTYIGFMFGELERAFDGHTAQIDIIRRALGFPTSKQGNDEQKKG